MAEDTFDNFVLERSPNQDMSGATTLATMSCIDTITSTNYTVPDKGNSVSIIFDFDPTWMIQGEEVIGRVLDINFGRFRVIQKTGTTVLLQYENIPENTHSTETMPTGTQFVPASFSDPTAPNPTFYYRLTGHSQAGQVIPYNIVSVTGNLPAGQAQWATAINALGTDQVHGICIGSDGSIYFCGESPQQFTGGGINHPWIGKLSAAGQLLWQKRLYTTNVSCAAYGIAIDPSGKIAVTGTFCVGIDFNEDFSNDLTLPGIFNIFVATFNSDGSWTGDAVAFGNNGVGGGDTQYSTGLKIDPGGNIFVTGIYSRSIIIGGTTLPPSTDAAGGFLMNGFIFKINNALTTVAWAKAQRTGIPNGARHTFTTALAVDSSGNAYVGGMFKLQVDFGNGIILVAVSGEEEAFIAKYNSLGLAQWSKGMNAASGGACAWRAVVGGANLYIAAEVGTSKRIRSYATSNGTVNWTKDFGNHNFSFSLGKNSDLWGIDLDLYGNVVCCGRIWAGTTIDIGDGVPPQSAPGTSIDWFVASFTNNGIGKWLRRFSNNTYAGIAKAIAGHPSQVLLIVAGMFDRDASFDGHPVTISNQEVIVVSLAPGPS